jgi:hypothetical protein
VGFAGAIPCYTMLVLSATGGQAAARPTTSSDVSALS